MWKHLVEGFNESCPFELNFPRVAEWPWRKILTDGGLVTAFALTSSWLMRG
jgi:hypothetical protein